MESKHVRVDENSFAGRDFLREHGLINSSDDDGTFESDSSWNSEEQNQNNISYAGENSIFDFDDDVSTETASSSGSENLNDAVPKNECGTESSNYFHSNDVSSECLSDTDAQKYNDDADIEDIADVEDNAEKLTYYAPSHLPSNLTSRYPTLIRNSPSRYNPSDCLANTTVTTTDKPTLKQALNTPEDERKAWIYAIESELASLEKMTHLLKQKIYRMEREPFHLS